jgi:glycerol-3-phosphate acyltransferase PlsX
MRRIAVDAMGGDHAPAPEVQGAVAAARERDIEVILVGDEARLRDAVAQYEKKHPGSYRGRVRVVHASQVIAMDEHPGTAFKSKKDSSMRVAFNLVATGGADAVLTAGNSGAALACGVFLMKRIAGVERPGITTLCPTKTGSQCVVLDVGANTEVKPTTLAQFAMLGIAYARTLLGRERPRVAVLSNGEEESKGTELTRGAHRLLRTAASAPDAGFEFVGYAEGRDLFDGGYDVVVTDGFTGNVALKTFEGTARFLFEMLEQEIRKSNRGKLGALLLRNAFRALKRRLEPEEYGGALLLGLDGVAVVSHGRATGKAIKNAIFTADRLVGAGLTPALAEAMARHRELWEEAGVAAQGAGGKAAGKAAAKSSPSTKSPKAAEG